MNKLKHIYQNELGWTTFIKYFQYLDNNKENFSPDLFDFARDETRYELNGDNTLHDSWLKSFNVFKNYEKYQGDSDGVKFIAHKMTNSVEIVLLHAMHEKDLILNYSGVTNISCSLDANYRIGHPQDLLVHEFDYISPGVFRHFIEFDSGIWIDITFTEFKYTERPLLQLPL